MDRITNEKFLAFGLVTTDFKFTTKTETLGFKPINNDLKYINNGYILSFELKVYDNTQVIIE